MNVLEDLLKRCAKKKLKQAIVTQEIVSKMKNVDKINKRLRKAYIYAIQLEYEMKIGNI